MQRQDHPLALTVVLSCHMHCTVVAHSRVAAMTSPFPTGKERPDRRRYARQLLQASKAFYAVPVIVVSVPSVCALSNFLCMIFTYEITAIISWLLTLCRGTLALLRDDTIFGEGDKAAWRWEKGVTREGD